MSWPIPTPDEIAARQLGDLRTALQIADDVTPNETTQVVAGVWAQAAFELYLFQRLFADELMPDKATEWLPRHADIWGVPRLLPTAAGRDIRVQGADGTVLPAGVSLISASGVLYTTTAAATVAGGTAVLHAEAVTAGAGGNIAAGTSLSLVNPIAGLSPQTATVLNTGWAIGTDIEEIEDWRVRILATIRNREGGGSAQDYEGWARRIVGAQGLVAVYGNWAGLGSVGVICALPGGVVPGAADIARIQAVMEAERPVTAEVIVLPVELLPVAHTIRLFPDTIATRAAVTASLNAFYGAQRIGEAVPLSRVSEAISAAAGENSHELLAPAAAIKPARRQLPVLGAVTWAEA